MPSAGVPAARRRSCIRVASGRSVTSVADDDDMPTEATIYNWRIQDVAFFEKLSRAQEIRKEATRHKMIALADRVLTDDGPLSQWLYAGVTQAGFETVLLRRGM